jgi:hypothetical protein
MKFTFERIQQAFVEGHITLEQFIQVLIDNFGAKKTRKILRTNIKLAIDDAKARGEVL